MKLYKNYILSNYNNMSNFMDFLKTSGSSKTNRLANDSFARTSEQEKYERKEKYEKKEKKLKIKNYRHGNNVIVTKVGDAFKGYFGHVTDFFPATYELKTEGETYVEADSIVNQDISKSVITKFGKSKVLEKIAAIQKGLDYIEFIIYTDNEKQKIGLYINDTSKIVSYLESQGNDSNQAYMTRENKNNNFVRELKQDDLVEVMKRLQTDNIKELIDGINSINLNEKTDSIIELLRDSVQSWSADSVDGDQMIFENGYPSILKLEDFLFDRKISIVFNKDIIGQHHYMLTVGENKGWNNVYKPDRNYYKIKYESVIKYKPGEIKVDKENRKYASVKKGEYSGKKFLIIKYNKAKISVRLTSNNHEIICEPSDVFYFDIQLENGNIAEVIDTLLGNKLEVREKLERNDMDMGFKTTIISEDQISERLSGFTLNDTENEINIKKPVDSNVFDNFYIPSEQEEQITEIYDDEDEKSQSGDYEENENHELEREDNLEPESNEGEAKSSFKDTERTSQTMLDLTNKQQEILNMIKKASGLFKYYIEEYDVLSKVESVIECLKNILKKNSISDYNIRFIIVLIIMYESIKNNTDHDFDNIINKLFKGENSKGFFSVKDLSAESRNNFIFFESALKDPSEIISKINLLTKNKKQSFTENKQLLKELILYADSIVQRCIGYNINIKRKYEMDLSLLIPLGINTKTGRRYKDEIEDNSFMKLQNSKQRHYTFKNILENSPLPKIEVQINWDYDSKKILAKFIKGLENKARQQPDVEKTIMTIKDNLYRAPFSIRDDNLDSFTKLQFETVYLKLKSSIIEYKENNSLLVSQERDRINENRKRIYNEKEELFGKDIDIDEPDAEVKLSKRQKLYNLERSLNKAQVSVNKSSYADKKKDKE